jgi:hypothetical protein
MADLFEDYLTPQQLAEELGVSVRTVVRKEVDLAFNPSRGRCFA